MATATKKTVDVVKSVTVQEEHVLLDISKDEATTNFVSTEQPWFL